MTLPSPQTFNPFDWFLAVLLLWSTIAAFVRGIIRVLFSFAGLIAGLLLASWYYRALAARLPGWLGSRTVAETLAFFLIFIAAMLLASLIARLVRRTAKLAGLSIVDRLLGALFGFARGCLLGVALFTAIAAFTPRSSFIQNSRLAPYFLDGAHAVSFLIPSDLRHRVIHGVDELRKQAPLFIRPRTTVYNRTS